MMGMVVMLLMMMMILNMLNKNLIQMIFQVYISLIYLYLMVKYPLNNLINWMMIYEYLMMDMYSLGLVLLTLWIFILMMMVSEFFFMWKNWKLYLNMNIGMMFMLILCFSVNNMMYFYIFFEASLIPIFMLIMGWGGQIDRIEASMYMMIYTMWGSFPLLLSIIYLFMSMNTMSMDLLIVNNKSFIMYLMLIMGFLVKMPMYFVHLWLPKAHVEAPIMGSMILAGVMLKLGSYGMLRVMMMMMNLCMKFNKFIMVISLMGGIYSSVICLCQSDMKSLVAYSSIVHMSMLMCGMMTLFNWGILGGYLMMLAHGLCSSGMFCLVNINYERVNSRSLLINKGMINYMPSMSLMWFYLCSCNMSFPLSLNLFSEVMLINSLIIWSKKVILLLMLILFFSASYTLYLYSFTQHGKNNLMIFKFMNNKIMEFLLVLLHWIPLNLLFLCSYMYM